MYWPVSASQSAGDGSILHERGQNILSHGVISDGGMLFEDAHEELLDPGRKLVGRTVCSVAVWD